jgi:cobyrinic acid a,c-diamide synthase
VTAALAYYHRQRGRRVRVFKVGPDFLDPMILEYASGAPVYQLDLWMVGEDECRRLLYEAAGAADLILVEGVMGFYDGIPSTADVAEKFDIPAALVINAGAMAQTFQAIAHGLTTFRKSIRFAGVIANNVAGARHAEMLSSGFNLSTPFLGSITRDDSVSLPERHLGLVQAEEIDDLPDRLERCAALISSTGLAEMPEEVEFTSPQSAEPPELLSGVRIAIARDKCFSFIYRANIDLLQKLGAELIYFSPLDDKSMPPADCIYLPGGYPELYIEQLQDNRPMKRSIHDHFESGKAIYAECGGMLYLLDTLTDKQGKRGEMVGILSGSAVMQRRLERLGYQQAEFPYGQMRGHTFHYSKVEMAMSPYTISAHPYNGIAGEAVFHSGAMWASYLHLYFPSNYSMVSRFFLPVQTEPSWTEPSQFKFP